jgi:hypothetical protein
MIGTGVTRGLKRVLSQDRFDRFEDRLRFHHHPAASAVGRIVGDVMFVVCVLADVMDAHADQSPLARAFENAGFQIRRKYFGEEREDLELHAAILSSSFFFPLSILALPYFNLTTLFKHKAL